MSVFLYALRAPETRRQYPKRLKVFLDFLKLEGPLEKQAIKFLARANQDPRWAQVCFMRFMAFQKERARMGEISYSTIGNYYKATKLFVEMNSDTPIINWKKISRGIPSGRKTANDRAPTIEELRKLSEYPDRRMKSLICVMASSGIRIGAWDYLRWRDVSPIEDETGQIVAARLAVYAGDPEEYRCFITPEAYVSLKDWIDFRSKHGERISGDSWLMRDLWQTTEMNYGAYFGVATYPKKLKQGGLKSLLERAIRAQGLYKPLLKGAKRREWKGAHGLRKFYKTRAEQVMKAINVEITMRHDIGLSGSYYRPTEKEVREDYLKAVPYLTIDHKSLQLQNQVKELTEKYMNEDYIMKGKLVEKDEAIRSMKDKYDSEIAVLKQAVSDMQDLLRNPAMLLKLSKLAT